MINNFCDKVQKDLICIGQFIGGQFSSESEKSTSEQDEKVGKAAIRILAVLGMALALGTGIGALSAIGAGTLFKLAGAGLFFTFCHDVFVITANSEKGVVQQLAAVGKGVFADLTDFVNGKKSLGDAPRHPLTEGTLLRPFWDLAINNA